MRLPLLKKTDNRTITEIKLSGIDSVAGCDALYDAVNLVKKGTVKNR